MAAANVNVYEKLWRQELVINRFVLEGRRDPEQVSRILQEMIIDERKTPGNKQEETGVFRLIVDYVRPLVRGISAGRYDYVNSDIKLAHFPLGKVERSKGRIKIAFRLFHPDKEVESVEVLGQIAKAGFRPATLRELLSVGECKPDMQREFPIIALKSIWRNPDGGRSVTGLYGDSAERRLTTSYFVRRWSRRHRFLVVTN